MFTSIQRKQNVCFCTE